MLVWLLVPLSAAVPAPGVEVAVPPVPAALVEVAIAVCPGPPSTAVSLTATVLGLDALVVGRADDEHYVQKAAVESLRAELAVVQDALKDTPAPAAPEPKRSPSLSGQLKGTVTDEGGIGIPGVMVRIESDWQTAELQADMSGRFKAPSFRPEPTPWPSPVGAVAACATPMCWSTSGRARSSMRSWT